MTKFETVATGGTFDIIHKGHLALLSEAFVISSNVIIGLTGDELANRRGKSPINNYQVRLANLKSIIDSNFPEKHYKISKLENDFGPAVLEERVEALVVSQETQSQGNKLNQMRKEKGLRPVQIIVVPMVLASDGKRISTSRIKNSEIDSEGNLN